MLRSLDALAGCQQRDGAWAPERGGFAPTELGQTGLVALAFLGAGHTHRYGKFKQQVKSSMRYLLRAEARVDAATGEDLALAALALGESWRLTRSPLIRAAWQRTFARLRSTQAADGRWEGRDTEAATMLATLELDRALVSSEAHRFVDVPAATAARVRALSWLSARGGRAAVLAALMSGTSRDDRTLAEAMKALRAPGAATPWQWWADALLTGAGPQWWRHQGRWLARTLDDRGLRRDGERHVGPTALLALSLELAYRYHRAVRVDEGPDADLVAPRRGPALWARVVAGPDGVAVVPLSARGPLVVTVRGIDRAGRPGQARLVVE